MRTEYTATGKSGGITERYRQLLSTLHRKTSAPFSAAEASKLLSIEIGRARQLLNYLCGRGWLSRVRAGLYVTVPLDATIPSEWREDSWIVATRQFSPCYIGGWSACEHWGLTEQIFRDVAVVTESRPRNKRVVLQGTGYLVKAVRKGRIFGTRIVWRRQVRVQVSDPSRTIVDILDDPAFGGGIRQIADVLSEYFKSEHRNDAQLLAYVGRLDNRTVFKRLGYLTEALGVEAPQILQVSRERMSSGLSSLDPTVRSRGRILKRWNLRVNVDVHAGRGSL